MNSERQTALGLIEEGIQLLRRSPAAVYALYCAGTVPFLLGLFRFCAEMSYSRDAAANCAGSAAVVALTYCWMKGLQAFACRELVRVYTGQADKWWEPATMVAIWSRQIAFQPFGFLLKPIAWFLMFPVTYVSGFFQNLTILGGTERDDVRKSWQRARLWPKQSYSVYGLLSLLALMVFLDLYAIVFAVPFLLKLLLGIESFMTRSYAWAFSPVLLIAVAAVSYFLIDLLAKSVEVIRSCDGASLTNGADLLRRLAALPDSHRSIPTGPGSQPPAGRGPHYQRILPICLALFSALPLVVSSAPVDTSSSQVAPLTQPALDRQIERVLQDPEYNWRGRPDPAGISSKRNQKSAIEQWMESVRKMLDSLGDWIGRLLKSMLKPVEAPDAQAASSPTSRSSEWLNALGYLLWAAFAGSLILLLVRLLRLKTTRLPPSVVPLINPDLAAPEIEANELPDDQWHALARQKMASGEFRLAQRALFLAILSYLASHHFITVERWKSNTDYERELTRKAKKPSELPALFAQSRLSFERCWYGTAGVTPEDFDHYHSIYQKIKHEAV